MQHHHAIAISLRQVYCFRGAIQHRAARDPVVFENSKHRYNLIPTNYYYYKVVTTRARRKFFFCLIYIVLTPTHLRPFLDRIQ